MNKISHRYQASSKISKIQANLKEMKEEVDGFLKKNNKETVPPVLRGRHYLLIDTINHIDTNKMFESPQKLIKDLSSQALNSVALSTRFEPLRVSNQQKRFHNKIVKQKRGISISHTRSKGQQPEVSCLLPNICNIKMDYDDNLFTNIEARKQQLVQKKLHETPVAQNHEETDAKVKKYQSIDLCQSTFMKEQGQNYKKTSFKGSKKKWVHRSLIRKIPEKNMSESLQTIFSEKKNLQILEEIQQSKKVHNQDRSIRVKLPNSARMFNEKKQKAEEKQIKKDENAIESMLQNKIQQEKTVELEKLPIKKRRKLKNPEKQTYTFQPWQDEDSKDLDIFALNNPIY